MGVTVARVHQSERPKPSPSVLWHRHLGHPSYKVLSSLPVFQKLSVDHTNSCEIFFRAKQSRGIFHDSINKTTEVF